MMQGMKAQVAETVPKYFGEGSCLKRSCASYMYRDLIYELQDIG